MSSDLLVGESTALDLWPSRVMDQPFHAVNPESSWSTTCFAPETQQQYHDTISNGNLDQPTSDLFTSNLENVLCPRYKSADLAGSGLPFSTISPCNASIDSIPYGLQTMQHQLHLRQGQEQRFDHSDVGQLGFQPIYLDPGDNLPIPPSTLGFDVSTDQGHFPEGPPDFMAQNAMNTYFDNQYLPSKAPRESNSATCFDADDRFPGSVFSTSHNLNEPLVEPAIQNTGSSAIFMRPAPTFTDPPIIEVNNNSWSLISGADPSPGDPSAVPTDAIPRMKPPPRPQFPRQSKRSADRLDNHRKQNKVQKIQLFQKGVPWNCVTTFQGTNITGPSERNLDRENYRKVRSRGGACGMCRVRGTKVSRCDQIPWRLADLLPVRWHSTMQQLQEILVFSLHERTKLEMDLYYYRVT